MSEFADVLIIGGGAYGLASALWMAERNTGARILVVDRSDFAAGGSGRNGAGFRTQWGLEFNIRLSQESVAFFEDAEHRLDYPGGIDIKQRGYLLLAHTASMLDSFKQNVATQHTFGVESEVVDVDRCLELAPGIDPRRIVGGAFCEKDGTASPFLFLDAMHRAASRAGAEIRYGVEVERLQQDGDGLTATTKQGVIRAAKVLICTDWAAGDLLRPLGIDIPITGMPKEGIVTEPCEPRIGPCLVSFRHDMFVNQVGRGNVVAIPTRHRPDGDTHESTHDFTTFAARQLVDFLPGCADLRLLRTWGGVISKTPDMQSVIGETDVPGVFIAVSAYKGFMTSPAVGRIMSELVLDGHSNHPAVAPLHPRRFETGELVPEPLTV